MTAGKSIVAVPYSGLGNRIRVLLSCEQLARRDRCEFMYFWPRERKFNGDIEDYWVYDERRLGVAEYLFIRLRTRSVDSYSGLVPVEAGQLLYKSQQPITGLDGSQGWQAAFSRLVPRDSIQSAVREFYETYLAGKAYVGVSVRSNRSVHPRTAEASPVEWYVLRLQELAAMFPGIRFFLSCDDRRVEAYLRSAVPNVVHLRKTGRHNSPRGVFEAIVDTYLLSMASHIVGPYWSSFVDLAVACAAPGVSFENSKSERSSIVVAGERLAPPLGWL